MNESELVSVVLPFSPLTSYRVLLVKPENVIETDVPVSTAISYIISMGAAGATNEILKESRSVSWVRLFFDVWNVSWLSYFYIKNKKVNKNLTK